MYNDSLQLFWQLIHRYQEELLAYDPDGSGRESAYLDLERQFRARHRGNHALLHQVNDLVDAVFLLKEYQQRQALFLGLQVGLELRSLDLLREE